jgi:Zn finger protein HypA/HybF involved in hydrogenase expression
MTSQTHKFVELSDILALSLRCKSCGSNLTIPATRDMLRKEETGKLSQCPVCRSAWAVVGGSSTCEITVFEFTAALNKLRSTLTDTPVGFTLTLEVHDEEEI